MKTPTLWPSLRARRKIELETEVSECGTFQMISVRGRLTIDTTPELLTELKKMVSRAPTSIKVNLQQVEYLDSSGISVLIQGLKLAQDHSVDYALLDPSPKVQAVIELSQLHSFFRVETSNGDACGATAPGDTATSDTATSDTATSDTPTSAAAAGEARLGSE